MRLLILIMGSFVLISCSEIETNSLPGSENKKTFVGKSFSDVMEARFIGGEKKGLIVEKRSLIERATNYFSSNNWVTLPEDKKEELVIQIKDFTKSFGKFDRVEANFKEFSETFNLPIRTAFINETDILNIYINNLSNILNESVRENALYLKAFLKPGDLLTFEIPLRLTPKPLVRFEELTENSQVLREYLSFSHNEEVYHLIGITEVQNQSPSKIVLFYDSLESGFELSIHRRKIKHIGSECSHQTIMTHEKEPLKDSLYLPLNEDFYKKGAEALEGKPETYSFIRSGETLQMGLFVKEVERKRPFLRDYLVGDTLSKKLEYNCKVYCGGGDGGGAALNEVFYGYKNEGIREANLRVENSEFLKVTYFDEEQSRVYGLIQPLQDSLDEFGFVNFKKEVREEKELKEFFNLGSERVHRGRCPFDPCRKGFC